MDIDDDDLKLITVENEKHIFLRFDSNDKTGNRILIFFSETSMMRDLNQWHVDDIFKTCPAVFYQMGTIQCVIQTQIVHVVYAFKTRKIPRTKR